MILPDKFEHFNMFYPLLIHIFHVLICFTCQVLFNCCFSYIFRLHYRYTHQGAPVANSASGVKEPRSDVTDSNSTALISPPPVGHLRASPATSVTSQVHTNIYIKLLITVRRRSGEGNVFSCGCLSLCSQGCTCTRPLSCPPHLHLCTGSQPCPPSLYRILAPVQSPIPSDMFKLVQLRSHCTGTPPPRHFETCSLQPCCQQVDSWHST